MYYNDISNVSLNTQAYQYFILSAIMKLGTITFHIYLIVHAMHVCITDFTHIMLTFIWLKQLLLLYFSIHIMDETIPEHGFQI